MIREWQAQKQKILRANFIGWHFTKCTQNLRTKVFLRKFETAGGNNLGVESWKNDFMV